MTSNIQKNAAAFDPAAHGWNPIRPGSDSGFTNLIGPFWSRSEATGWAYGFLAGPHHANGLGVIHGGMLMTFIDQSLGRLAWEAIGRAPCVTAGLNTHFIAGARPGDWVEARGRVVRKTRSLVFMQGALTVNDASVLTAEGIWKILGQA
ncbi:PaaI family thioesterase [Ferrovibrio sp.]|uniref:PaaI family thioesterase n=1 Tax=Ferrovibrio sp. TaxID=1917215 RepID=UPI0035AE6FE4